MSVKFNSEYITAVNNLSTKSFRLVDHLQHDLSTLKNKVFEVSEIACACGSHIDDPIVWKAFLEINDKHIGDKLRFDIEEMITSMNEAKCLRQRITEIHTIRRDLMISTFKKHMNQT